MVANIVYSIVQNFVYIVQKPKLCPKQWVLCYIVLLLIVLVGIIGMIIFAFLPKAGTSMTLIYKPDVVYIPLPSNAPIISQLHLKTNGTCLGTLYSPPCDKVNITYQEHYEPGTRNGYDLTDHIYCLNGSEFVFYMNPKYNNTTTDEQVWVFTDKYAKLRKMPTFDVKIDCNNPPPDSYCRQLVNGTALATIPVKLPARVGQYYYLYYNVTSVRFYVRRYYYPFIEEDYSPYIRGPVKSTTTLSMKIEKDFQPENIKDPAVCLYMHVTQCSNAQDPQYVTVTSDRREDLFVWFGVFLVTFILAILLVIIIHVIVKVVQTRKYSRLIKFDEE